MMLRQHALNLLCEPDLEQKLAHLLSGADDSLDVSQLLKAPSVHFPARPPRPELIDPKLLPKRSLKNREGRVILLHALAHIEHNAINLALDIVWRFAHLPEDFYRDWWQVAREEAEHFLLLRDYLRDLGADYGDFPAHNGLWEMAKRTSDDVLARLHAVPRTLEAHGLDVAPLMREKFLQVGDTRAAEILAKILHDEIGHVALGNRWFYALCAAQNLDPQATAQAIDARYHVPKFAKPFNLAARQQAGFCAAELAEFL